jgi:hypothetical protein
MTKLSSAANAVWEAFNQEEAGVFVDYGDKLAAALRAAVDELAPEKNIENIDYVHQSYVDGYKDALYEILIIVNELEAHALEQLND